jgi:hypothetical protein
MQLYFGHKKCSESLSGKISVGGGKFRDGIVELRRLAEHQRTSGNAYMRVTTKSRQAISAGGYDHSLHAENICIEQLLALDLDNMIPGQVYLICDRNWAGEAGEENIPYLAVKKENSTPPTIPPTYNYKFGILHGTTFQEVEMEYFEVYKLKIV